MSISNASGRVKGTVNATVEQPEDNRDQNNKLASLVPSVGNLEPVFQADVTAYKLTVTKEITEVTFTATAQSNKAQVVVTGGTELRLGENTATITVTAENGSALTYNITIMCGEAEKIQIGDEQYTFNYDFTDEQIPIGFTRTKIQYSGREYEAVTNANDSMKLVSLRNEETTGFFVYKESTKEFLPFVQIILSEGKYIIPLALNPTMAPFKENEKVSITYLGKQFEAWKLDDEFSIVCVMNDEGKELLYRYDSIDGVFQRYVEVEEEKTLFPNEYYMYAIAGLGALVLILLVSLICVAAKKKKKQDIEYEDKAQAWNDLYSDSGKQSIVSDSKPKSKKRKHDARRRKVAKKLEKQQLKEEKKLEKQRRKEAEY